MTAAHTQMIEDGRWRGGKYPYGYNSQLEAEKEIIFFQDEVSKEERQIDWMNTQYKEIRDWASLFDAASLDTKKMILARLIEKITVDRDYNIEIFYYVTVEDFNGEACITASWLDLQIVKNR